MAADTIVNRSTVTVADAAVTNAPVIGIVKSARPRHLSVDGLFSLAGQVQHLVLLGAMLTRSNAQHEHARVWLVVATNLTNLHE